MKSLHLRILAALLSAALIIAATALLDDRSAAYAFGVAVFVALGGLSSYRRGR